MLKKISWGEFQVILDNESSIREHILDWVMHEFPNMTFVESETKELKPKSRESEKMYIIDNMLSVIIDNKSYYMVVFDDSTVTIFNSVDFSVANEFCINYVFDSEKFFKNVESI